MTQVDQAKLNELLQGIGKNVFVTILYPALKKDIYITIPELIKYYPKFCELSKSSKAQNTRLSKARTIFNNGWENAALECIAYSAKVDPDARKKAMELLGDR